MDSQSADLSLVCVRQLGYSLDGVCDLVLGVLWVAQRCV